MGTFRARKEGKCIACAIWSYRGTRFSTNFLQGRDYIPPVEFNANLYKECTRAGMMSMKIIVLHTKCKGSFGGVYNVIHDMYEYAFKNEVQIVCGDANQHYYFHSEKHKKTCEAQKRVDFQNGLFNLTARNFVLAQNDGMPYRLRITLQCFDNNSYQNYEDFEDLDCCFLQHFFRPFASPPLTQVQRAQTLLRVYEL